MDKIIVNLEEVKNIVDGFCSKNAVLLDGIDFVVGMSRGGLVPAALLSAKINKPLVAAYINRQDEIFFDRPDWIKNEKILVVDDIIRSGKTLWLLNERLAKFYQPAAISFFALYRVRSLAQAKYNLPAFSQETNDDVIFPWDYDRQ